MKDNIDGTLGLGPYDDLNGPSFVKALYEDGKIDSQIVSFQLNQPSNMSYAFFGEIPRNFYTGPPSYISADKRYSDWWTVQLNNIYYGEKSIHTSAVTHAIISTGQPFIYLSKTDFLNFKTVL